MARSPRQLGAEWPRSLGVGLIALASACTSSTPTAATPPPKPTLNAAKAPPTETTAPEPAPSAEQADCPAGAQRDFDLRFL